MKERMNAQAEIEYLHNKIAGLEILIEQERVRTVEMAKVFHEFLSGIAAWVDGTQKDVEGKSEQAKADRVEYFGNS